MRKIVWVVIALAALAAAGYAQYPSGYFYCIFRGDTVCAYPVITDSTTEAAWFDYTSASMHTGYETAYESHIFFFYNPMTGNIGFVIQHNIDETGTTDTTCVLYLDDLPTGSSVAMSDDAGEFSLSTYPQGNWHWWDNTDGGGQVAMFEGSGPPPVWLNTGYGEVDNPDLVGIDLGLGMVNVLLPE